MRAKTIVSAGVVLHLNGRPYGRVTSFQFTSDTPRTAKYGIDSMLPTELAPTTTRVTGRIGIVRTVGDGGVEGAGMTTDFDTIPRERYFLLQLIERRSDTVIFEAKYCSLVQQSWSLPEKGRMSGEVAFEALGWNNEQHFR
jgi:hypothetical protein